ncbi:Uncharacterised protein [Mycobacteroides abscessus subsp. abscessus]|uniref:hypothetical protein n=1 Tax=Mycobacteroides abscessus TaxID=36809 RepID=UPI0009261163|nr:hypothetical protein [Mycobacteroides abscessus]SIC58727.1 Uncharacterised protein [Mycobacteroides abscessus subsp. abscessus]SIC89989.1 Uncharacterised protein [Mycobacteroides abscessus subsp. abscessus]SID10086.1 Uncharacterised protein [Mycobacteroides abscessus subsp. abscessus]SID18895.1 Uncharacterised protein [Mycobacteroides abscessus subsp. abscessus]SKT53632.1 Uncharacterised protein [Mycobacteroides abscessus subsp. abscessus]
MSATWQLIPDALGGHERLPGSAATLCVLIIAMVGRIIRSWIRLIIVVIVAAGVGVGVTLAAVWAVESNVSCACDVGDYSVFH